MLTYIGDVDAAAAAIVPSIERFRQDGAMLGLAKALSRAGGGRGASRAVRAADLSAAERGGWR